MKALTAVAALMCLGLGLPDVASASCFFIYKGDQLVYRSVRSPVDLSKQLHETMVGRYAGAHLTMIPDETGCPDLLVNGISEVYSATPGARTAIDASPLFRTGAGGDGSLVGGSPAQSGGPAATSPSGDGTQTSNRRTPRGR